MEQQRKQRRPGVFASAGLSRDGRNSGPSLSPYIKRSKSKRNVPAGYGRASEVERPKVTDAQQQQRCKSHLAEPEPEQVVHG